MEQRKMERSKQTQQAREPEKFSSTSKSEDSYTESPGSAAAKKASPEAQKASPPAKPAKKQDAYEYFLKKDQAAKGITPVEDGEDSDIDDTDESKEQVEDPMITKMKAEAARKKEASFATSPHKKAAPEPEEIKMNKTPSPAVSESYEQDEIPDMEDDDLELS